MKIIIFWSIRWCRNPAVKVHNMAANIHNKQGKYLLNPKRNSTAGWHSHYRMVLACFFPHLWAEHTFHKDSEVDFNAAVRHAHSKSQITFILLFLNSSVKYKPGELKGILHLVPYTCNANCKLSSGENFLGKNPLIFFPLSSPPNFVCNVINIFGICKERKPW